MEIQAPCTPRPSRKSLIARGLPVKRGKRGEDGLPGCPMGKTRPVPAKSGGPGCQRNLRSTALVRLELSELLRIDRRPGPGAVLVEGLGQRRGHLVVGPLLKVGALEHEDLLAVLEEADRGRGGRILRHVL